VTFNKINDILQHIINELQDSLSKISPLMFLIDLIGKNNDEKIINSSMNKARTQAWNSANLLWSLGERKYQNNINKKDGLVHNSTKTLKTHHPFWSKHF
jgi:hypothetical protein